MIAQEKVFAIKLMEKEFVLAQMDLQDLTVPLRHVHRIAMEMANALMEHVIVIEDGKETIVQKRHALIIVQIEDFA